jgi:two-component system chemotaxis sensor kinase CheA
VTVTGHEDEFRRLFEQEAGTRLSALAERAMELEASREDPALVAEMFRDAHTLKGGAAVVGFGEVASVVHELEQLLEELRSGARRPDGALVDGVLAAVDAVREMVERAMRGLGAGAAAGAALAAIAAARGERAAPERPAEAARAAGDDPVPLRTPSAPEGSPAPPVALDEPVQRRAPVEPQAPPSSRPDEAAGSEPPAATPRARPLTAVPAAPAGPPGRPAGDAIPVPVARLDELVRLVGESAAALLRIGGLLGERIGDDPGALDEYRELARVLQELQERTMRARMVSVATIAGPLRRAVRDIARASGKQVRWELAGEDTELDRHVLEQLREPLVALVRNATDHGIEPPAERAARGKPAEGVVRLHARQIGAEVVIAVGDDGRGIDVERVRARAGGRLSEAEALEAIFEAGLTTVDEVSGVSGRGVGLDAVRTAVGRLRGRVEVSSRPGLGTEFRISVPLTLAVLPCLLVAAGGRRYALPMHSTAAAVAAPPAAVVSVEGRPALVADGDTLRFTDLAAVLGAPGAGASPGRRTAVIVATPSGRHAFGVEELVGQRDVVVKDLGRLLPRLPLVAGAGVEPDGGIMLVLDPDGLVAAARVAPDTAGAAAGAAPVPERAPARILVVDDTLTIRELQRSILRRAGYEVATAPDGDAALRALAERPADLVVTDVEMPGMDGFALTRVIRETAALSSTPVLILTSRAGDEDRRRGLEAGADAYLAKSGFDQDALLAAVRRLLGDGEPG